MRFIKEVSQVANLLLFFVLPPARTSKYKEEKEKAVPDIPVDLKIKSWQAGAKVT